MNFNKAILLVVLLSPLAVNGDFTECSTEYAFTPIAGTGIRLDPVSGQTDGWQQVSLPFSFPWTNGQSYSNLGVSGNGGLTIPAQSITFTDAFPIGGSYEVPRIVVAQEDLHASSGSTASVYQLDAPDGKSTTFSWESIPFFSSTGEVNAQVTLYDYGGVVMCWGTGNMPGSNEIAAGMDDKEVGVFPVTGFSGFNSQGVTSSYPSNRCACFDPLSQSPSVSASPSSTPTTSLEPSLSMIPSQEPTNQPSSFPSFSPSEKPSSNPTISLKPSAVPSENPTKSNAPSMKPSISDSPSSSTVPSLVPTQSQSPSSSAIPSSNPSNFDTARELLTTLTGGNGFNGNMFNLEAKNNFVFVEQLELHFRLNTPQDVQVYTRDDTYLGFELDPTAWTLVHEETLTSTNGQGQSTPLSPFNQAVRIDPGQTKAFYVTSTENLMYINGIEEGRLYSEDQNLKFYEGKGIGGPFGTVEGNGGSTLFSPRVWNGIIYYTAVRPTSFPSSLPSSAPDSGFIGDVDDPLPGDGSECAKKKIRSKTKSPGQTKSRGQTKSPGQTKSHGQTKSPGGKTKSPGRKKSTVHCPASHSSARQHGKRELLTSFSAPGERELIRKEDGVYVMTDAGTLLKIN